MHQVQGMFLGVIQTERERERRREGGKETRHKVGREGGKKEGESARGSQKEPLDSGLRARCDGAVFGAVSGLS